ncbi:hypothetical protein GCM10010399_85830 [Dactylosporangium fulvum]|uniref:Lipoprotein n=1 Tax=Dactylosporangium fulvum TaxID=53359 RepID=A0ABY5WCM6_9ACTN|nr:hypothetical protein [Dactylosporangium fulvum]UWP87004.1 hypothetical protein Dfulv_23285 [Dactylosporangium fulvum]
MRWSVLVVGVAVALAAAGCGDGGGAGSGDQREPSPQASAGFRLTADELWDRYPAGAAWQTTGLLSGTIATIRVTTGSEIPACGKQKVPTPASAGGHLESGMTDKYLRTSSFGVVLPDTAAAEAFLAQLKTTATACESVTAATRTAAAGGTDAQRAGRTRWGGFDVEFPYTGGRGALGFRQRGNVVVAVFVSTSETSGHAAEMTFDTLDTNLGMLLDRIDGTAVPRKVPVGQVDADAVCGMVGKDTLATLAGGRIDQRVITTDVGVGCTHTSASGTKVRITRLQTAAPKTGVFTTDDGVGVSKGGTVVALTVTPKAALTAEQWTKVGEEISGKL